jgi:hypothetical protein
MESGKPDTDDALLNLGDKSVEELRGILDELYEEEQRVSYKRRVLHGKMDILRAELVRRLSAEREGGGNLVSGDDIARLIDILASDLRGVSRFDVTSDEE